MFIWLCLLVTGLHGLWRYLFRISRKRRHTSKVSKNETQAQPSQRKPDWVKDAVISIAARRPRGWCTYRKVAISFNQHYRQSTVQVGKDYVGRIVKLHRLQIEEQRRHWRARVPVDTAVNHTWAIDITYLGGNNVPVLAVLDHGSRALLHINRLQRKTACAIARCVIDLIERYGVPRALRTDNEGAFASGAMRQLCAWFGIRHQRNQPYHPWKNGRIERLFGTLKH
jgi:putative transposase